MHPAHPDRDAARRAIVDLLDHRGDGKTICPSEAARALANGDEFRQHMELVRDVAWELAAEGVIEVTQRGEPVASGAARGPIRLRRRP